MALFFGTWIDQFGRQQRLLIAADLFRWAAVAAIPIAYGLGQLSMSMMYGSAIAMGIGGVVYNGSYPSFFVRLVPKAQYVAANSVLSTTMSIAALAGPAAAGLLIQAISAPDAVVVDAATFLISAVVIMTVRTRIGRVVDAQADGSAVEPYLLRLRSGLSYLTSHAYLRASLMASTMMNFAGFAIQAVLILYATRHLHMSAGQIGIALSIGATGGLLGAATAAPIAARIGAGKTIAVGAALSALPFAGLVIASATPSAGTVAIAAAEFVSAWALMLFDINNNALRATVTADHLRSRVSGAYSTVSYGSRPLGALLGGWAATVVGIPATLVVAGVIGALGSLWILRSPITKIRSIADL